MAAFRSFRAVLSVPTALVIAALGWLAATPAQAESYYWGGFAGKSGSPGFSIFPPSGVGSEPTLSGPQGMAVDASDGAIYVADTGGHTILKVLPNGTVTTISGTSGVAGSNDTGFFPTFRQPYGMAVDANHILYVADFGNSRVRKLVPSGNTYTVSTVKQGLTNISAIAATPTGTLYVIANGVLSTMNGTVSNPAVTDISDLLLGIPAGLAVDSSDGDLYIADRSLHTIVKRTSAGVFSLVAGSQADPGFVDATGAAAKFNTPLAVAVDPVTKNVYVADSENHAIRKIDSNGVVTTLGGGMKSTTENGIGANAGFQSLTGVALGRNGEIYAIDSITGGGGRITRGVEVTGAISLTEPTAAAPYGGTLPVKFTLPSAAQAGSVKLYLDDGIQNVFRCTFSNANATAGLHTFTMSSLNPMPSGGNVTAVDHLRFGTAIPSANYTATLEYTDSATGKPVFTLPTAGVVIDTAPPVFAETGTFNTPYEATSPDGAAVSFDQGVSDALSGVNASTVTFKRDGTTPVGSGAFFPIGQSTLDFSATDNAGNVATKQVTIYVQDTIAPSVTAPATITLLAGTDGTTQVGNLANRLTISDAATASPTVTQSVSEFALLPVGRYPITFTVTDGSFNRTEASSTLIIAFPPVNAPVLTGSKTAGPVVKGTPLGAPVPNAMALGLDAAASIGTFFTPAISDRRDLVARAILNNGTKKLGAIYRENSTGTGSIVALEGGKTNRQVSDAPTWKSFLDPLIAPDGSVTFYAKIASPTLKPTEDEGLWSDGLLLPAVLTRVLWEGHDAGVGVGITLKSITSVSVRDQEIIALVKLAGTGVLKTNDQALLRLTPNQARDAVVVTTLLRTGDSANPVLGGKLSSITAFVPGAGATGQGNTDAGTGVLVRVTTDAKGEGIMRVGNGGISNLIVSNKFSPTGLNGGLPTKLNPPCFAGTGLVARLNVKPTTGKPYDAIALQDGLGADGFLAVGDARIPSDNVVRFKSFFDPVGNAAGQSVFRASLTGVGVKAPADTGLYEFTLSGRREIVRGGSAATDAAGAAIAGATFKTFLNYALPNDSGVIFVAEIAGKDLDGKPFTAATKLGLWAENRATSGKLQRLLAGGQPVTLAGNVVKTLASFRLLDALPGSFGSRRSYNSSGSAAVLATFTDKSQAILRIDIP